MEGKAGKGTQSSCISSSSLVSYAAAFVQYNDLDTHAKALLSEYLLPTCVSLILSPSNTLTPSPD